MDALSTVPVMTDEQTHPELVLSTFSEDFKVLIIKKGVRNTHNWSNLFQGYLNFNAIGPRLPPSSTVP
jgi:hypothetical protein